MPGNGNKEPNSLDPYLHIVVDELLSLSNKRLFDAYHNAPFYLKVQIFMYVIDYPGIGKVFNVVGSGGYMGCAWCEVRGKFE